MEKIRRMMKSTTFWVMVFGLIGWITSAIWGNTDWVSGRVESDFYLFIQFIKSGFLTLLKMFIGPVIFFGLVGGLLNIGGPEKLKSMGKTAIIYYLSTTGIAIIVGLVVVFFIHPWTGQGKVNSGSTQAITSQFKAPKVNKFIDPKSDSLIVMTQKIFQRTFDNPVKSFVENNVLGIAALAFLIGLAIVLTFPDGGALKPVFEQANAIISRILAWIIRTTPIGVFAITFDFQLQAGSGLLKQLLGFFLVVVGATLFHGLVVLPLIARIFAGQDPIKMIPKMMKPLLVALTTSSSSATLPVSIQTSEEKFGVTKGVSGFVFPLGATMNMDGTALFEGIAVVFLAHIFNVELTAGSIVIAFFMAMISSIGAPGMPSGSMAGMQIVLLSVGIPLEAIGVLLIVEKPLDTIRTAVNVEGDIIGALVVQNQLDKNNNR